MVRTCMAEEIYCNPRDAAVISRPCASPLIPDAHRAHHNLAARRAACPGRVMARYSREPRLVSRLDTNSTTPPSGASSAAVISSDSVWIVFGAGGGGSGEPFGIQPACAETAKSSTSAEARRALLILFTLSLL